jgi:hypothetical protein
MPPYVSPKYDKYGFPVFEKEDSGKFKPAEEAPKKTATSNAESKEDKPKSMV